MEQFDILKKLSLFKQQQKTFIKTEMIYSNKNVVVQCCHISACLQVPPIHIVLGNKEYYNT